MTRDYAKRKKKPAPKAKPKVPAWVWLFTGCVLGGFITFLVYLTGMAPDQRTGSNPSANNEQKKKAPDETNAKTEKKPNRPEFEFYNLLKEGEVEVVEPEEPLPLNETLGQTYYLQVGSFKSADDADRLRAQMILLNLDASVKQASLQDGQVWHRVMVGPFESRSKLSAAEQKLLSNNIKSWRVAKRQ